MTGPPTPPPSSATEIEDAARATLPPPQPVTEPAVAAEPVAAEPAAAAAAPPLPEQVAPAVASQTAQKTSYELLFPSITELARSGSLQDLIEVAERGDLSAENDRHQSRLYLVVPLVLVYLIVDRNAPAFHALSRLPDNLSAFPLVKGLASLLASVSERKYVHVYTRAEQLRAFVSQPDFDAPLGQLVAGMLTGFVDAFRKRTLALLARAYTSIPLQLAQGYLGLTAEQVVDLVVPAGWDFHETTYVLTPPKRSTSFSRDSASSTLYALNLVAEATANLEA
ncbi:hypothetical protein C8Q80DRAFT_747722 [Daedaleopsis nitida]|nr:hypothetical protein C8Q80DRAFT_747722 [Daedaleopsis nitida]